MRLLLQSLLIGVYILTLDIIEVQTVYDGCGIQGTFSKIYGGEYTAIDEFPWTALLLEKNKFNILTHGCSGTIIDERIILTAAHCVSMSLYIVRLGEHDLSKTIDCVDNSTMKDCADPPQDILVDYYESHPSYANNLNDIALIFLKEKINYTEFVQPICLPESNDLITSSDKYIVSGWGKTENGVYSNTKLKVSVPVKNFADCYRKYTFMIKTPLDKARQICAGEFNRDSCIGDSGSALMTTKGGDRNRWKIIGVTSFGMNCGDSNWPGVYARVSFYLDWIQNTTTKFKLQQSKVNSTTIL